MEEVPRELKSVAGLIGLHFSWYTYLSNSGFFADRMVGLVSRAICWKPIKL
jgi:hypothetical protein